MNNCMAPVGLLDSLDRALAVAKERVSQILVAAMSDRTGLKTFVAGPSPV